MIFFKQQFWRLSVLYGRVFGRAWLAPLHHAFSNLSLHALGYDNCRGDATGEKWFIRKVLARNNIRLSLDIGANVGTYSSMLAKYLQTQILAFEPSASSFAVLEKVAEGSGGRIKPVRLAFSNFEGTGILHSNEPLSETATLAEDVHAIGSNKEMVSISTIDTYAREHGLSSIDFIKIDTEGFEREVLQGMHSVLQEVRPSFIQFEFNILQLQRGYTLLELALLLPGYTLYRLLPNGMLRIRPKSHLDNVFMYSNVVCIRNDLKDSVLRHV